MGDPANQPLAAKLCEMADVLAEQEADGFRISAYRRAANTIELLDRSVREIAETAGLPGLLELPSIGRGIGQAIMEMLSTGRWGQLERLQGSLEPEQLFQTLPGIGPKLAARSTGSCTSTRSRPWSLRRTRVGSPKCLGSAGGAQLPFAPSSASGWTTGASRRPFASEMPPAALLLDVDHEYREKANAGKLRTIAPKRFNPTGEAWLPVLHTARGDWRFTTLYPTRAKPMSSAPTLSCFPFRA